MRWPRPRACRLLKHQFCPVSGPNRTKLFHVKHFGPIDALRINTFARRGEVGIRDLAQAECCIKFMLFRVFFFSACGADKSVHRMAADTQGISRATNGKVWPGRAKRQRLPRLRNGQNMPLDTSVTNDRFPPRLGENFILVRKRMQQCAVTEIKDILTEIYWNRDVRGWTISRPIG